MFDPNLVFECVIAGLPGPQGSKKHVGNGVMVESSKKVKPWRQAVVAAVHDAHHGPWPLYPRRFPVRLEVCFTLPAPGSVRKTLPNYPSVTPDVDKLIRSTFDAVKTSGLWHDDAQVVQEHAVKSYPQHVNGAHIWALPWPGALIRIAPYPSTEIDLSYPPRLAANLRSSQ